MPLPVQSNTLGYWDYFGLQQVLQLRKYLWSWWTSAGSHNAHIVQIVNTVNTVNSVNIVSTVNTVNAVKVDIGGDEHQPAAANQSFCTWWCWLDCTVQLIIQSFHSSRQCSVVTWITADAILYTCVTWVKLSVFVYLRNLSVQLGCIRGY